MLYRSADVFVLPSYREPYGTVYGEAMAAGLPVVGWRAGNLPNLARARPRGADPRARRRWAWPRPSGGWRTTPPTGSGWRPPRPLGPPACRPGTTPPGCSSGCSAELADSVTI